jgi:hypothetical protein
VPNSTGATRCSADHALRPCLLVSCHRAAPGELQRLSHSTILRCSVWCAAEAASILHAIAGQTSSVKLMLVLRSHPGSFVELDSLSVFSRVPPMQVTHGGDNFKRTAPCPLCFSQIAARELRLFTARQVKPIKVRLPWLVHVPLHVHCLHGTSQAGSRSDNMFRGVSFPHLQVGDNVQFALLRRPRSSIIPHEVRWMPMKGPVNCGFCGDALLAC